MKKKMCVTLLALTMALSLGACGAAGSKGYDSAGAMDTADMNSSASAGQGSGFYDVKEEAVDDAADAPADAPADDAPAGDAGEFPEEPEPEETEGAADVTADESAAKSNEKIIYTYNYSVETKTFDEFMKGVQQRVNEYGGYMESSEVHGNEEMNITRYANLVIRIPADKMPDFLDMVKGSANVTYSSSSSENVTLSYVDMKSHVEALKAEQKSLMDMLEHADSIEAIITIQTRLTDVRYELESYESQLRVYDNRINYSTLYLDVSEVDRESNVATKLSYGEEVSRGLSDTLYGMGQGLRGFSIWVIVNLPVLLLLAVIVVIIVLIVRALAKRSARKNAEYMAVRKAAWTGGVNEKEKKPEDAGQTEEEKK